MLPQGTSDFLHLHVLFMHVPLHLHLLLAVSHTETQAILCQVYLLVLMPTVYEVSHEPVPLIPVFWGAKFCLLLS